MATEKQIAANRLNAQKCTGPRTPAGKANSSQNALKTGLHSRAEVMACEDQDEHQALIAEYYRDFAPLTAAERFLVDALIRFEWLNRRYAAAETSLWERGYNLLNKHDVGFSFLSQSDVFGRLDRCRNSAQRNYDKTLARLREIQLKRLAPAETEVGAATNAASQLDEATQPPAPVETLTIVPKTEPLATKLVSFRILPDRLHLDVPTLHDPADPPAAA